MWHSRMAVTDGQDFRDRDILPAMGTTGAKAQSRTATVGLVRVGGALSSTALPLCNPFSTSENLVPPTFRGSQSAGKD